MFGICNMEGEVIRCRYDGGELVELKEGQEPDILLSERMEKILNPKDVKVIWGGRGSGKTRGVASVITERMRYDGRRALCMREIQRSISESSHQELSDEINRRNLAPAQMTVTEREIRSKVSKGKAWFAGLLRNVTNIKGKAGLSDGWCDEAENVSQVSWNTVMPTLRANGSELFVTFNPRFETDPSWTEFVEPYKDKMVDGVYEDENILVIECNWRENPWFTEKLARQKDLMMQRDVDRYNWIWEGKFNRKSDIQVLGGKWSVEEFEPGKDWNGPYFGADFGFSQDPATLVKLWIYKDRLYLEHEAYATGVELDEYPDFYDSVEGSRHAVIMADEAEPATISHIKRKGFRIKGATKGPGSIEKGITYLRNFDRIVIHPRCVNAREEAILYQYKQDPLTEEILPVIIDKHNHIWDAVRYALVKLINKKRGVLEVLGDG